MPKKKAGPTSPGAPPGASAPTWQVILEEIKSQNRSTIEVVESSRSALEQRIDRHDQESRARDATLELAVRQLRGDLGRVEGKVDKVEGKVDLLEAKVDKLDAKVDKLVPLEERVAAVERRA